MSEQTKRLEIKTSLSDIAGVDFTGFYETPETLEGKIELYGADIINFFFESRIVSALRHKVQVILQRDKDTPLPELRKQIQETLNTWKPSLKERGKITEAMIKKETDPAKRRQLITDYTAQLNQLDLD